MYTSSTSTTNKKSRPSTGYLIRPKLGRSIFSPRIMSAPSQDKKKKFKRSSSAKMEFRKKPDYADTAYREAVSRLRILLAESYTAPAIKRPLRELDSAGEDTDNQSLVSGNSNKSLAKYGLQHRPPYYHHYLTMLPRKYQYYPTTIRPSASHLVDEKIPLNLPKFESNASAPPELMSFIEKQEDYIEQLEKESRFCRDELASLLSKVKDVISENENLHEKQKNNIMKSVFNHLETETETETETDLLKTAMSPKKSKSKTRILEGPAIVFESRISELEAQLTQAKIDLRKALDENENYKKKVSEGSVTLDGIGYDSYRKQLDTVQKEKDLLQETVQKLQVALSKVRDKENLTCDQVKRSLDVAEQAQYEKNAADLEIRRLKDELERQHSKLRDAIADQGRRVADERNAVERRYTQQIEQLTTELGVQWESTNKLQLDLDKQRRENTDLRRELAQKQALLDEMRKDMQNKIMNLQSDIGMNGAEKNALEQQIASLQMANERTERQAKQEAQRLQAEMQSLRQRLDRADADLIHSRRENIRLSEQVASLEKEIKINSALSEEKSKSAPTNNEILALPPPKEMTSMINDMEAKHAATVAELEGMIHSQNQLMDKLSIECHSLTQKLEDASSRHKIVRAKLRTKNHELLNKLENLWDYLKQHDDHCLTIKREEIRELQTSLDQLNNRLTQSEIITSSNLKDEDYRPISNNPRQTTTPSNSQQQMLSRTNSRNSIQQQQQQLSRHSSQEQSPQIVSSPPYQQQQSLPKTQQSNSPNGQVTNQNNFEQYQQQEPQQYAQEGYDQSYDQAGYDPNQTYEQEYDPNYDPNAQQQYAVDENGQYVVDPNQQQQYETDNSQQEYANEDQQQYDPNKQQYSFEKP